MIKGKKILLGITGSIAAYKSAFLVRLLVKAGAEVKVVMTPDSLDFTTPLTLATLSKNRVYSDFTEDKAQGTWSNHVELGLWADLFVIAPLTANSLSALVTGAANNFLLATFLSARCETIVAPAMDLDMFIHPSTQENLKILRERGTSIIEPESGELASGLEGKGRMSEPENIVKFIQEYFLSKAPLKGKKAIVSAGPTYEKIDSVRFIGNHSTGKMGYAIAIELANQGAEVQLISGPSHLADPGGLVTTHRVKSADEMYVKCHEFYDDCDIAIMSAAVADFKPKNPVDQKIKKTGDGMTIELIPTLDILKSLGQKKSNQVLVGFALETNNEEANAKGKLKRKNLDLIVLNSLNDKGAGFGHDTNKVSLIDKNNKITSFELKSKTEVAKDIISKIIELCD